MRRQEGCSFGHSEFMVELLHEYTSRCTPARAFAIIRHPFSLPMELTMNEFVIYHNPRCSKSRATLALLEENGITPEIVLYLDNPLEAGEIEALLAKLGIGAAQLVRRGEADYKEAGLGANSGNDEIVAAMAARPKLIERPVVVKAGRAVLGRPPENVLELIS